MARKTVIPQLNSKPGITRSLTSLLILQGDLQHEAKRRKNNLSTSTASGMNCSQVSLTDLDRNTSTPLVSSKIIALLAPASAKIVFTIL